MPKLPQFENNNDLIQFSKDLLTILCQDERTRKYISAEMDQYPTDELDELLTETSDRSPDQINAASDLLNIMSSAKKIADTLKAIAAGETDRWNELQTNLDSAERKDFGEMPSKTVANYVNLFGAESFGNPMVQFCFAMTQGLSNVFDRVESERSVQHDLILSNGAQNDYLNNFSKVDNLENEFISMCIENNINPAMVKRERTHAENVVRNYRDLPQDALNKPVESEERIKWECKAAIGIINNERKYYEPSILNMLQDKHDKLMQMTETYNNETAKFTSKFGDLDKELKEKDEACESQIKVCQDIKNGPNNKIITAYQDKRGTYNEMANAFDTLVELYEWNNNNSKRAYDDYMHEIMDFAKKKNIGEDYEKLKMYDIDDETVQKMKDYTKSRDTILGAMDKLIATGVINKEQKAKVENTFRAFEAKESKLDDIVSGEMPLDTLLNNVKSHLDQEKEREELKEFLNAEKEYDRLWDEFDALQNLQDERDEMSDSLEEKKKQIDKLGKEYHDAGMNVEENLFIPKEKREKLLDPKCFDDLSKTIREYQTNTAALDKLKEFKSREDMYRKDMDSRLKKARQTQYLLSHPDCRLKPGETLGEYEKKYQTLVKLDGKRLELESENREKYKSLDNEMLSARAKGEVARNNKFRDTITMFQNLLQPGDRDKNSKYYNDMIDALTVAKESFSSNSRQSETTKAQAMERLSQATKAYVDAKESQFRPFPTVRRNTRLQSAKSLLAFAENADKQIKAEGELDRNVFRSVMERDAMGKQDASVELANNIAKKLNAAKTAPQKTDSAVQRSSERASINMNIPNNGH